MFFCVASTLNFARAAEKLNVTQPAVKHQIRSLENELNVTLFNRSVRNVSLTPEGELLLPEVKDLLIHFNSLQNKFTKTVPSSFTSFKIGCMSDTLCSLLPDVLYDLALYEPNIHPVLHTFFSSHLVKTMEENLADVVLGIRDSLPKGSNIEYTEILKTPLVCVCDQTHPLSEYKNVTLEELNDQPLIFLNLRLVRPT